MDEKTQKTEATTPQAGVAQKKNITGIVFVFMAMVVVLVVSAVILFAMRDRLFGATEEAVPTFGPSAGELLVMQTQQTDMARIALMEEVVKVDVIYNNIFINGIDVSGLTQEAALEKVTRELAYINDFQIAVSWAGGRRAETYTLNFSEFGVGYQIAAAVARAYEIGRSGSLFERFTVVMGLNDNGYHIEAVYYYDNELVLDVISQFLRYNQPAVDATLVFVGGSFSISEGRHGYTIDVAAMQADITRILNSKTNGSLQINTVMVQPNYTAQDLENATSRIGSFTTYFARADVQGTSDWNRNENIRIASDRISGITVLPGEVFSTNDAFGPVTAAFGWRPGGAFLNGRVVQSIGGGMCQVSSTLYVALVLAELEIVERRNHSMPVTYVPMAFDATLVTGAIDLRFRNNTDFPITIEAIVTPTSVTVNIYGVETRDPARTTRLESRRISVNPPPAPRIIEDPTLLYGSRSVEVQERTGFDYRMYMIVYMNGVRTQEIRINNSHYRTIQGEIRVGTGGAPHQQQPEQPPYQPYQPYQPQEPPVVDDPVVYDPIINEPVYTPNNTAPYVPNYTPNDTTYYSYDG